MAERLSVLIQGPTLLVSADKTQAVTSLSNLQDAVAKAVNKWVVAYMPLRTLEGNLTVEELAIYVDDPELVNLLALEGVVNLRVEQVATDTNWTYDTDLMTMF